MLSDGLFNNFYEREAYHVTNSQVGSLTNVPHRHGASSDSAFVQLAITSREAGPTEWLQAVSEEEHLH